MEILVNPRIVWMCMPDESEHLHVSQDGPLPAAKAPAIGDVVTLPYIVSKASGKPVAVRVVDIIKGTDPTGHVLGIVVQRSGTDGHQG